MRLLVTSAGTGSTNNLVRSLRAAGESWVIAGCHEDRFALVNSIADVNVLLPPADSPAHARALCATVRRHRIDLVIPHGEADVGAIARLRRRLPCRTFLPAADVLALCRDKYRLVTHLARRGVPVAETHAVTSLAAVPRLVRRLGAHDTLWCRIRTGAGSMGATPVRTSAQAASWIRYWHEMRGVAPRAFTLSEYLPGRDYACQTLWQDGRLVLAKTTERLSYFEGWSRPSGVSSVAALAKTVIEPGVVDVSARAVRALGPRVTGAFSVDLKESAAGVPCVTEINAGRFITMLNLFDLCGKHNMSATYVRLALGQPVDVAEPYDAVEGHYLVRDVDRAPGVALYALSGVLTPIFSARQSGSISRSSSR